MNAVAMPMIRIINSIPNAYYYSKDF